jgi:hypothetical protein
MSVSAQTSKTPSAASRIDFGWIRQARLLAPAQIGVWAGTLALSFLINAGLWALLSLPTDPDVWMSLRSVYAAMVTHTQASPSPAVNPYLEFAQTTACNTLLAGIYAIFTGGLYRTALRQKRGEPISVSGLFSAFPQSLPLFLVGIVVPTMLGLVESVSLGLLHTHLSPAHSISAVNQMDWLIGILLNGLLMFAPLLIVDAGASAPEALLGSVRLLGRQWLRGIGFYIVASFVGGLGLILCGVGMLATYPIFLLSIAIGYLALTQPAADEIPGFDPAPQGVWPPPPRIP